LYLGLFSNEFKILPRFEPLINIKLRQIITPNGPVMSLPKADAEKPDSLDNVFLEFIEHRPQIFPVHRLSANFQGNNIYLRSILIISEGAQSFLANMIGKIFFWHEVWWKGC